MKVLLSNECFWNCSVNAAQNSSATLSLLCLRILQKCVGNHLFGHIQSKIMGAFCLLIRLLLFFKCNDQVGFAGDLCASFKCLEPYLRQLQDFP